MIVQDQMGRQIWLERTPVQVVSLVPSLTEFLLDIDVKVIGRTKFCVHPKDEVKSIKVVGGTKKFRFEEINRLSPDLIIGNKEENYQEGIRQLEKQFPVWMSDMESIQDSLDMMRSLGELLDRELQVQEWLGRITGKLERLERCKTGSALYLIWKDPWMAAGKSTYIDSVMTHLGYENVLGHERYPELTLEEIKELDPEGLLLSSEPYPFKEAHRKLLQEWLPNAKVELVDGEAFSWYGTRLAKVDLH